MKCLLLFLLGASVFTVHADDRSPIRNICGEPARNSITLARTVTELSESCELLSENGSQEVARLSTDVLDILQHMNGEDSWQTNPELASRVARLTDAFSDSIIPQQTENQSTLRGQIENLARNFRSVESRRSDSNGYYTSIKNIISQTSDGQRLINCLENNPDKRINGHEIIFIGDGPRRAGNDQAAYLEVINIENDESNRKKLVLSLDVRTNPIAAIAMVAHEMQHACNASAMCDHLDPCDNGGDCKPFNQTVIVDELRAHNLEAQFFAELAEAAPAIMCEYTYIDGVSRRPKRLSDLHAENQESYQSGALLDQLAERYIRAQMWFREDVYSSSGNKDDDLISRIREAGIPGPSN